MLTLVVRSTGRNAVAWGDGGGGWRLAFDRSQPSVGPTSDLAYFPISAPTTATDDIGKAATTGFTTDRTDQRIGRYLGLARHHSSVS